MLGEVIRLLGALRVCACSGFSQRCEDYCDDLWSFDLRDNTWLEVYEVDHFKRGDRYPHHTHTHIHRRLRETPHNYGSLDVHRLHAPHV